VEYEALNIRFQRGRHGAYTVIASSPRGEAAGEFRLPFADIELENFILRIGTPRRSVRRLDSPEMTTAKTFGSDLFDALFQSDVRDLYHTASAEADAAGRGIRVTLRLGQTPELADVPWEYLCDDGRFISVSERTPIVRYLDLKKAYAPLAIQPPLRILGMVSDPEGVAELDVAAEKRRLDRALERPIERGLVDVVWLESATLTALLEALDRTDFHIFHYIGHGGFDEAMDDGVLVLEDADRRPRRVTGMKLGQLISDKRTLRLAVLNACEGGRSGKESPFAGVAASLVKFELPSVVAMQFEITDKAAIVFAGGFYSALARGEPIVGALAAARKAIWADYNDIEWGTPVLFMRIADGRIFDFQFEPADTDDARQRLEAELVADPTSVARGEEVAWQLIVRNPSQRALANVTRLHDDGSHLELATKLEPGRRLVTRWRTRPDADVDTSVTVTATDVHGDRIIEQVSARVSVERNETAPPPPADEPEEDVSAIVAAAWELYGPRQYEGWENLDRARADRALAEFDRALALAPDNVEALAGRAHVYLDTKRDDEALADFDRALERDPDLVEALVGRGRLSYLQGAYDDALRDLERAVELAPDDVSARINRGWILASLGRHEEALGEFDRALELDPNALEALDGRGCVYVATDRLREALADFDRALELDPDYVEALERRGQLHRTMGRPRKALFDLNRALKLSPEHVASFVDRGRLRSGQAEHEKAVADFDRALKLEPDHLGALAGRGSAYAEIGRAEEALRDLNRVLAVDPEHVDALCGRGRLAYLTDRSRAALVDLNRVLKLDPDNVVALLNRGYVRQKQGQHDKAIADFDRALALEPGEPHALAARKESLAYTSRTTTSASTGGGRAEAKRKRQSQRAVRQIETARRELIKELEKRGFWLYGKHVYYQADDLSGSKLRVVLKDTRIRLEKPNKKTRKYELWQSFGLLDEADLALRAISPGATKKKQSTLHTTPKAAPGPRALVNRAWGHHEKGEYDKALAEFNRALKLDSNYVEALVGRGRVYHLMDEDEKALTDLNRAIVLDSNDVSALINRGWVYHGQHKYEKAFADFDRALELDASDVDALHGRGLIHGHRRRYADALADLNRALKLDPDHVGARLARGRLYYLTREDGKALTDLNRALRVDSDEVGALINRGWVYYRQQNYENAFADFDRAHELDANNFNALYGRGLVHRAAKRYAEALADLNRALKLNPDHVRALVARGRLNYLTREDGEALTDLNRAIALDPNNVSGLINRGWVYYRRRGYDKAFADFDHALKHDPDNVHALSGRQRSQDAMNKPTSYLRGI
jgi:tetratricopeptide (TPR) repeat protein